jgi:hypothetical protein
MVLFRSSDGITSLSKIVITSKVSESFECFFFNWHSLVVEEAFSSINEADKLNSSTSSLFLESEESINNVVATWRLRSKVENSNIDFLQGEIFIKEFVV